MRTALNTRYIGFNNQTKPFDSDDLRRAFAQAVDREQIARDVLGNEVVPATRILPPGMVGTQLEIKPLAFDLAAAQAALAHAGFPGGTSMPPISLAYAPEGENELVVRALQQAWSQNLGVTVALRAMDTSAFSDALNQTWLNPQTGLQIYYSVWGADYPDPQNFLSLQLLSTSRNNNGHWCDPLFDQIISEADRISARAQIQRRLLLYNQAEQIAIDQVGWLPILHTKVHLLIQPRVQGILVTPSGLITPD